MKKRLCLLLAASCLIFALAGCKDSSETPSEVSAENTEGVVNTDSSEKSETAGDVEVIVSDDKLSLQLQINNDLYNFPMKYEEFIAMGWENEDETAEEVDTETTRIVFMKKDGLRIQVYVRNVDADNTKPVEECLVGGVGISDSDLEAAPDTKVFLPGGFECFTASAQAVRDEFGTPSMDSIDSDTSVLVEYEYDSFKILSFKFPNEEDSLSYLYLENFADQVK